MSSTPTVYLITGANRGIGHALVNEIVTKHSSEDVVVIATARDVAEAKELKELSDKHPGKIDIVQYLACDVEQNRALAKSIEEKYGYLDVVVANAATATYMGTAAETPPDVLLEHLDVNVVGVLVLFQAIFSLLEASKKGPKFIPISSAAASLTAFIHIKFGYTCYGATKVALNYIARKIHFENEWITCFPLAPGIVDSQMSRTHRALDKTGTLAPIQDAMSTSAATAATNLLTVIDGATREKDGGEFMNVDGTKIPW